MQPGTAGHDKTNPILIDTHAHLDDKRFRQDIDAVIERAFQSGVKSIITVGADAASSKAAIEIARRTEGIWATAGVHPSGAGGVQTDLARLYELAAAPEVVAVGEIGLDYYWDTNPPRVVQQHAFEAQLDLAASAGKPVVIHIRDKGGPQHREDRIDAYADTLAILRAWLLAHREIRLPGVLHCFSGDLAFADDALELGFYLGIDGPVTYPNAHDLRSVVAGLPLDRLLLETDCPYLTPQARRGKRNEPAYLGYIAEKIAETKGISVEQVARVTTANAERLFGLKE